MKKLCLALTLALPLFSAAQTINPNQITGIGVYASGYTTLAAMETACGAIACQIIVTTPQTITLAANHTIPANIALRFDNGGIWTVNGAFTLTVGSGLLSATSTTTRIFDGTAAITGLHQIRPEWLGSTNISQAVISSLVSYGTVLLGPFAYTTAFSGAPIGTHCLNANNISIIGSQMPVFSSDWTGLVNGSIIKGGLNVCGGDSFTIKNVGLDNGSAWVAAGHPAGDGLVIEGRDIGNPADPFVLNPTIENVVAVTNSNNNVFHGFLVEHTVGASIRNVKAAVAFHCFAFKSLRSTLEGLEARSCGGDGLIIKGDNYTPNAGDMSASNIYVENINPGDTGAGIQLQAGETGALGSVHVSNFTVIGAVWGMRIIQSSSGAGGTAVVNSSMSDGLIITNDVGQPPIGFIVDDGGTGGGKTVANISVSNINFVNAITSAVPVRFLVPFNAGILSNWLTINATTSNLSGNFSINGWTDAGASTANPTFSATGAGTVIQANGVTSQRGNPSHVANAPAAMNVSPNPSLLSAVPNGAGLLVNGYLQPPTGGGPITVRSAAPGTPALAVQNSTGTANRFLIADDGLVSVGGIIQPLPGVGAVVVRGESGTIDFAVQNAASTINNLLIQEDGTGLLGPNIIPGATTQNPTGTCTLAGFIPMRLTNATTLNIAVCQ